VTGREDDLWATTECALDRPETSSEPVCMAGDRVRARFPGQKAGHFAAFGGARGRTRCEEAEEGSVCCRLESGDGSCAVCWSIAADPTPAELHRSVIVVRNRGGIWHLCVRVQD
jgi:hypothetical protein